MKVSEQLKPVVMAFSRLFSTEDGKMVLRHLEATFSDKMIASDDAHQTALNAAQHDVIIQIKSMASLAEHIGNEPETRGNA